jgi:hypothetical protein
MIMNYERRETKLTPWSRVLLEMLIFAQLVNIFPSFYGTQEDLITFSSRESFKSNPEVHYRVHNSPPLVPVLRHTNPLYTLPPCSV